jgi:hypothetical protein
VSKDTGKRVDLIGIGSRLDPLLNDRETPMTTGHALLAGLALIAAAIHFHGTGTTQTPPASAPGTVVGFAVPSGNMWRINTVTGSVSWCGGENVAEPPPCTPWSTDRR